MKKITLLAASFLLMSNMNFANGKIEGGSNVEKGRFATNYRDADPIVFTERGIDFYIFLDGTFDFDTQADRDRFRIENRNNRGNSRTVTVTNNNRGRVIIQHDYKGRVRRIGNVFINYDAFDRVKRIGTVYMSYNSFALKKIGKMKIIYNRRGQIIDFVGNVKGYGNYNGYNFQTGNNGNGNNGNQSEEDFYYYKKDGSRVKMSEEDIKEIKVEEKVKK